ncbi:uncharacterized protein PAC_00447 [Phialocephala subalpina]|uniref:Heterokaryon incompatibility domain-containing protein n=1 Tax=Phialocephala subalpina TaxID=576137 RepID=A0A1L7WCN3_9HELO|nr:uncharacterized protein PAC_00447 [Phialocephala subalpina]
MRLLKLEANGEFSLTNDITYPTTPYAILSHTWGEDDEEVTFEDLKDGSGKTKNGYKKLQFCGEQAARDGLQYLWVDTCCINKSNSTELSEAINSKLCQAVRHAAADAQGAQRHGLLSSLLARLEAAGVGVGGQDGAALGRGHWRAAADAQGAQRLGLLSSLLARLEAAGVGVGVGGQDGAALGRGHWRTAIEHRS